MKILQRILENRRHELALVTVVCLLALLIRSVGHFHAPNGWRDDELSNALVISQHVLNGDIRIYYDDASGHEGLYHWLQAITMALFGPSVWGIRGVSILCGTTSVVLTYMLTRRLFDAQTALITALLLTISFWSLMYSRSGQRHILVTVTTLLCFYLMWQAVNKQSLVYFAGAGLALGIGFYTYFASRGVPLIIMVWAAYVFVFQRALWHKIWRGLTLTLGIAFALSIPLLLTLRSQPEAEARVEELARPIYDALDGDFSTIADYTLTTASMFTHNGDSEVLYNVAHRPVFGLLGGVLFWLGIGIALYKTVSSERDSTSAFLLLWVGAGLAPGVLSVPAASLGHTILAQPVAMMFPALALTFISERLVNRQRLLLLTILLLIVWETERGIYDYWFRWPTDDFNRVLHHSDLHEASVHLNATAGNRDVAMGSFLVEPWDQQALQIDLNDPTWRIRAYDPRITCIHDIQVVVPSYLADQRAGCSQINTSDGLPELPFLLGTEAPIDVSEAERVRFDNGLSLKHYQTALEDGTFQIEMVWQVKTDLVLPERPLLSKPPPPGRDNRPRLMIFAQLLDENGQRVAGVDAIGVDPYTLYPGDVFTQVNTIELTNTVPGSYQLVVGLYDPVTGVRIAGDDAQDSFVLETITVQ